MGVIRILFQCQGGDPEIRSEIRTLGTEPSRLEASALTRWDMCPSPLRRTGSPPGGVNVAQCEGAASKAQRGGAASMAQHRWRSIDGSRSRSRSALRLRAPRSALRLRLHSVDGAASKTQRGGAASRAQRRGRSIEGAASKAQHRWLPLPLPLRAPAPRPGSALRAPAPQGKLAYRKLPFFKSAFSPKSLVLLRNKSLSRPSPVLYPDSPASPSPPRLVHDN